MLNAHLFVYKNYLRYIHLIFASPAGFHFCLETKTKQKIQGCFHFLTVKKIEISKQN